MPDEDLILHVKGTEQETTTLPKKVVRAAISQGQITHSQLIWSPPDNAWKQVREMPHLLPSQKLAPAPVPRVATGTLPKIATGSLPKVAETPQAQAANPVPRVAVKASAGTPAVKVAVKASPAQATVSAQPKKSYVVKEEGDGPHPLMWLCMVMGILVAGAVGANFLLVDRPMVSALGQTPYSQVTVYAHLGAFIQPNVIVIHIPKSTKLTRDNLTDFLVALARSTPSRPMSDSTFDRIGLTTAWTAQYTLSGYAWKQLGEMGKDEEAQRKEFLLDQLGDAVGSPVMAGRAKTNDEAALQAARDKVWNEFSSQFTQP